MASSALQEVPITIVKAHSSDFPTLARIAAEAMSVDLIHRVLYPSANLLNGS